MKKFLIAILLLPAVYLATGFYIVQGNEKGVVRRFGRVVRTPSGEVQLVGSGIHFDLPPPFAQVDRINMNEVRTIVIGVAENEDIEEGGFLRTVGTALPSQFLTGDKNILNLQITVRYRIAPTGAYDYLFASESPRQRLRSLVESHAADLVSRSGVDYVNPLGLGELRALLTSRIRELAAGQRLGLEVDEVTISSVYPPVRVKADFIDVSNARADRERYINSAFAYSVQKQQESRAQAQQILDEAEIYRRQQIEAAKGAAFRFEQIVKQFAETPSETGVDRTAARRLAMQRLYLEAMEEILRRVKAKVLLDSGKPVDLTIFRENE